MEIKTVESSSRQDNFSVGVFVDAACPDHGSRCLALAQHFPVEPILLTLKLRKICSWIPRRFWNLEFIVSLQKLPLEPPWPDLLLVSGPVSSTAAMLIKHLSQEQVFTVSLNTSGLPSDAFDMVIQTAESPISLGPNVIESLGAFSNLTNQKLQRAADRWFKVLSKLPQPWITVFVDAAFSAAQHTQKALESFAQRLITLSSQTGGGLMLSFTPDTPTSYQTLLKRMLSACPHHLATPDEHELREAFLGLADYVLLPAENLSLINDALVTDKPLYLYPGPQGFPQSSNLYDALCDLGYARPFKGKVSFWARAPFSEDSPVAKEILKRFQKWANSKAI